MKLVTTKKMYLEDTIFEISYEIIEKYSGLNACAKVELEGVDLSDLKQEGNALVYVGLLDINGKVDMDALKRYKRVILVALGAKYQNLLKQIFDLEYNKDIEACNLYDLEDCYIIGDNLSTKTLEKETANEM